MNNEALSAEFGALTEEELVGVVGGDWAFVHDLGNGIGNAIALAVWTFRVVTDPKLPVDLTYL